MSTTVNFEFGIPQGECNCDTTSSLDAVVVGSIIADVDELLGDSGRNYITDPNITNLPVTDTGYLETIARDDGLGSIQLYYPDSTNVIYKRVATSNIIPSQGIDYYDISITSSGITLPNAQGTTIVCYALGTNVLTFEIQGPLYFSGTNSSIGSSTVRGPIEFTSLTSTGQNFGSDSTLLVQEHTRAGTGSIQVQFNASGNYSIISNNLVGMVSSFEFLNGNITYNETENHATAEFLLTWNNYTGGMTVGNWVLI